ncbi:MAG: tyrosine-type recombinase/integrase [Cellvibrionaceae bacterium]
MATISARKLKSGIRYTAQIRITRDGQTVYTESETFDRKSIAQAWAKRRESELERPGVLERLRHVGVSLSQVLEWYRDDFDGRSKFGRSKLSTINFLIGHPSFERLDALNLTSGQLVEHVRERRAEGAGPSTVNNDLIWLRNAFRAVRIGRDIPLDVQPIDDAGFLCRSEGLIAKARERDRRPTLAELDSLLEYFSHRKKGDIPMVDIVLFAIFSSRRQDEICRIRWEDLDEGKRRVLVRDMKHPKKLIDTWVFLPDRAWSILQRQALDGELIFPYNGKSVSSAFTRACKLLGIEDLRFHDLRHEAASHMFELGWDIPKVAGVTGHRSWSSLQRYTHIHEHGVVDRYAEWERVT